MEQEPYVSGLRCEEKFDHLSTDEYQRIMQQNAASMRGVSLLMKYFDVLSSLEQYHVHL